MAILTGCVVGGGQGGQLSLTALARSPHFSLVAAADLRPEVRAALERQYPGIRTFATHQDMFATCPTDVVCVSTWAPSHEDVTRAALTLPLQGILVEKPLGDTAAAGRRIIQSIKRAGIPMVVPHGLMVKRYVHEMLDRLRNGEIGDLRLVEIQSPKWDIMNAGIHWLHFLMNVAGGASVESVLCACDRSSRTYRDGFQVETASITQVNLANGVRGIVMTGDRLRSNGESGDITFRLVGTRGMIECWGWQDEYRVHSSTCPGLLFHAPDPEATRHQIYLESLLPQIATGNFDYSMPEASLAALEVVEAAYLSARHGCEVHFPLATFVPPREDDWDPGTVYSGTGGGIDGKNL